MQATVQRQTAILNLWSRGLRGPAIALQLGVSRNVVLGHVHRARLRGDIRAKRRNARPGEPGEP